MSNEDLRLSDKRKATQTFLRERKLCFPADLGLFSIQFWCQMKDWGVPEFTLKKKGGLGCRISQFQIMCASFEYLENVPVPIKGNKIGGVIPK